VITFDEGSDAAACCGGTSGISPSHPNVPRPGKTGSGGGRIGAVLLSPLIRPGTVSTVAYNHYSPLRTIEDIFGLPHLGGAAMPQVRSFGPDVIRLALTGHESAVVRQQLRQRRFGNASAI
jgi:phosphatidylinositol-3-phosphatase